MINKKRLTKTKENNNTSNNPKKNFGLTQQSLWVIQAIMKQSKVIIDVFANPYILSKFDSIQNAQAVIMSYEDNDYIQSLSAQAIFGGVSVTGKLPVTASSFFKLGSGIETGDPIRFKYTVPEELNINRQKLAKIDSIALKGIRDNAYPGCQILLAKEGKVFYQKSFGYHTYEHTRAVRNDDIYDLASITKIADRKSTRLNSSHSDRSRMPSSA